MSDVKETEFGWNEIFLDILILFVILFINKSK